MHVISNPHDTIENRQYSKRSCDFECSAVICMYFAEIYEVFKNDRVLSQESNETDSLFLKPTPHIVGRRL